MKSFFKKIQQSEEKVKKRYLFIFSAIAMAIIIFLWIFYLKTITSAPIKNQTFLKNFFVSLKQWLKVIFLKIKEGQVIIIER